MKLAIIGAGNMGGALARGLSRAAAFPTGNLYVANPSPGKLEVLDEDCPGIHTTTDNVEAVRAADWILLAVKPWKVKEVLEELKPVMDYGRQVVLSVAAGIGTADLGKMLEKDGNRPPVFYVMPNTAVAVGEGMVLCTSAGASGALVKDVLDLFALTGKSLYLEERLMAAGMMLSGCGIAYAMRYIRAAQEGGVEMGLYPKDALEIVLQTVKGAAELLLSTGNHPETEIDKVTTPGGLTIKGLNEMEHSGFTSAVVRGLKAGLN